MSERLIEHDLILTGKHGAWDLSKMPIAQCMQKLQEYEDLEEQGLLLRLPCKVGDTVYIPRGKDTLKRVIDCVLFDGSLQMVVTFGCDYECAKCIHHRPYENFEGGDCGSNSDYGIERFGADDIGKTVFLTREAAEKALAEMNAKNDTPTNECSLCRKSGKRKVCIDTKTGETCEFYVGKAK